MEERRRRRRRRKRGRREGWKEGQIREAAHLQIPD